MVVLSKIMTKGGDGGFTSLGNGDRVPKDSQRIAAIGVVDELNAMIGLVLAHYIHDKSGVGLLGPLKSLQNDLFDMGADLSIPYTDGEDGKLRITQQQIMRLEKLIVEDNKTIEPISSFVLPGGSIVSAYLHVARTLCRRAERTVVSLKSKGYNPNPSVVIYLNRLGDLLFIWSRLMNDSGHGDILWEPGKFQFEDE